MRTFKYSCRKRDTNHWVLRRTPITYICWDSTIFHNGLPRGLLYITTFKFKIIKFNYKMSETDWIHCNIGYHIFDQDRKYYILSCFPGICRICMKDSSKNSRCQIIFFSSFVLFSWKTMSAMQKKHKLQEFWPNIKWVIQHSTNKSPHCWKHRVNLISFSRSKGKISKILWNTLKAWEESEIE
jgi:hypothetical protein